MMSRDGVFYFLNKNPHRGGGTSRSRPTKD